MNTDADSYYGSVASNPRASYSTNNNISSSMPYQMNTKLSNSIVGYESPYDSRYLILNFKLLVDRADNG